MTQPDPDQYLLFPYENRSDYTPIDLEKYPGVSDYLRSNKRDIESRHDIENSSAKWYELRSCNYYDAFEKEKIIYPDISDSSNFALDDSTFLDMTGFILRSESKFYLSLLNSSLLEWYLSIECAKARGGYLRFKTQYIESLPLLPEDQQSEIVDCADRIQDLKSEQATLNTNLHDYLGNYSQGRTLGKIGRIQPPAGAGNSIFQSTESTYPDLRVGRGTVVCESKSTVNIQLTARYKPEMLDEDVSGPVDGRDPDRWGYVETDLNTVLRITDLTEIEANLIRTFVPIAIDEAGGFANFRETATKTNSLIDRLYGLTLPAISDVETGLESYMQTKQRAEELETKIEQTDDLINEIVYELYGLTDEEIEIVEESVSE